MKSKEVIKALEIELTYLRQVVDKKTVLVNSSMNSVGRIMETISDKYRIIYDLVNTPGNILKIDKLYKTAGVSRSGYPGRCLGRRT